jgi:ribosomal protein L24, bacterial/organelle
MRRIKKGDEVIVITGKDRGRRGNVIRVLSRDRVLVENINMVKRHTKPNPARGITGAIIEKEMPMHVSNVAHYNPTTKKADRVGFRILQDGRKVRYFKSNNEVMDV